MQRAEGNRPIIWYDDGESATVKYLGAYYGFIQLGGVVVTKQTGIAKAQFVSWDMGFFESEEKAKAAFQDVLNRPWMIKAM